MTWTTCQPPRPSGTEIFDEMVPPGPAVGLPSGTDTNVQQVPVQLTRLPTTVDHSRSTGAFGVRPEAMMFTRVFTAPFVDESCAFEPLWESSCSVVFASSVGATCDGQSTRAFGRPLSFV